MKLQFLKMMVFVTLFSFVSSCDLLNKKDTEEPTQLVQDFNSNVTELHDALENFVMKAQAYENAKFSTLKAAQTKIIVDEYIAAGEKFVKVMGEIQAVQNQNKSLQLKSAMDLPCSPVDFIPDATSGISPGLVKNVADLISETKGDMAAIQKKFDNKEIDENTYNEACNQLKKNKTVKAVNTGIGAVLGTGAAMGAGLIVGATTLPAIATVTVVGVAVGTTVTWFANWYTGVKSTSAATQQYIVSGKTTVGGKLPVHLIGQGATVTLAVQGQAPVVMKNFALPAAGYNKKIEITPVKIGDATAGGSSNVCVLDELMAASTCSAVEFVTGSPSPVDPGPGVGVTVTGTLIPKVANCSISFSIVGTDGYSNSATKTTNAEGQATFYIPGGESGVFDKVTISSSNGKTYVVSYTF
jgi:hypothetical protein